jgi:hypothetical protein
LEQFVEAGASTECTIAFAFDYDNPNGIIVSGLFNIIGELGQQIGWQRVLSRMKK